MAEPPTKECLETLTENTRQYIVELEAEIAQLKNEVRTKLVMTKRNQAVAEKCSHCGAACTCRELASGIWQSDYLAFACGSWIHSDGRRVYQSPSCRIVELEAENIRLRSERIKEVSDVQAD